MHNENPVLPDATRVGRVRLAVGRMDRMLSFYEGVLGLSVLDRGAGGVTLGAVGEAPLVRLQNAAEAGGGGGHPGGLYHFALLVPDRAALAGALAGLQERGWPIHGASDHGVSEALYLEDPEGNGIEIYADRPRSSWRWTAGEVWMTSTPLDLRGLLADVDPSRGTSTLAAGTGVGHVHLHVSGLEAARRFYSDTVGLEVVQRDYPGALFMSAGRYHHHLGVNTWGRRTPLQDGPATGLVDWELLVPGADARDALLDRLRSISRTPHPDGGSWRVEDPDGIGMLITAA